MSGLMVVDSSVAYKWLSDLDEESVAEADALLDAVESGELVLVAPDTLHVELANALKCSRFEPEAVLAMVDELDAFEVELVGTTMDRLHRATELAYRHRMSVYDALFLALAEELDCPLVTADKRAFAGIDTKVEIRLL